MSKKSGVTVTTDNSDKVKKALAELLRRSTMVGIPHAATRTDDAALTNAQIGYIHEHGSPKNNLPARPFLAPGIRKVRRKIARQLRDAADAAMDGNTAGVKKGFERAGLVAQNSVRAQFVDNDWPELSPATLNARPITERGEDGKAKKHGKSRAERGATNPLIDTGQLRKSITYIVTKKGKGKK